MWWINTTLIIIGVLWVIRNICIVSENQIKIHNGQKEIYKILEEIKNDISKKTN